MIKAVVQMGLVIAILGARAEAQPSKPPTAYELFRANIEFAALDCDTEARTARVRLEFKTGLTARAATAAWASCVKSAKLAASKAFKPALLQFETNAAAQDLLKAYYALWLDHLATTGLELSRSDLNRSLRIEETGLAADQARRRFEDEAGLN